MVEIQGLITENLDIWTSAITNKKATGRGSNKKLELTGIKKLRELILELAVRGKLVPQDQNDEPASVLVEKIAIEKGRLIKEKKIKKQKILPEISDKEKKINIPDSWEWIRLPDLYYTISPSRNKLKSSEYKDAGMYPIIDQGQSYVAGYTNQKELLISIPNPVVVFGDHTKARKYVDFDFVAGADGTKILSPYLIFGRFFYIYLTSYDLENRGYARHFKILNENIVALPPLNEQHRIVKKVDELMALCDQLEQQTEQSITAHQTLVDTLLNALVNPEQDATAFTDSWKLIEQNFELIFTTEQSIDKLKQTILQLAVMGKLVPQDPNDEPASVLLEKIAAEKERLVKEKKIKKQKDLPEISSDEKPFNLPNRWEWARLQDIIHISSGNGLTAKQMNSDGSIPVFGGNGINGYHDKGNVDKPTLVIGRVGFYCGSIHVTPEKAWITDNAFKTYFSEKNIYLYYLSWLLKGTNLKENENATAQPVISGRKVYPIVIGLPPLEEQHRIVKKVDNLMTLCDKLKSQLIIKKTTQQNLATAFVKKALN